MKVILINGTGRSGSTLLQKLFDCHPDCLVWPFELPFRLIWKRAVELSGSNDIKRCRRDYINRAILENPRVHQLGQKIHGSAALLDTTRYDMYSFLNILKTQEGVIDTPTSYLHHFACSFSQSGKEQYFVIRPNDLPLSWYLENLPESKQILIIRDPVNTYLSYLRIKLAGNKKYIYKMDDGSIIYFAETGIKKTLQTQLASSLGDGMIIIKIEELIKFANKTMNSLCSKVGLSASLNWTISALGLDLYDDSSLSKRNKAKKYSAVKIRKLTRNELNAFLCYEKNIRKNYSNFDENIEVFETREELAGLFRLRLLDGLYSAKNLFLGHTSKLRKNLSIYLSLLKNYFGYFLSKDELELIISFDQSILELVADFDRINNS